MYSRYSKTTGWTYPLVISDGFQGSYWNDGESYSPTIATDDNGNIHVAWQDDTDGPWGTDREIMYVKFTAEIGWSNVSIVSDGFAGSFWNDGYSSNPTLDVDSQGRVHVAWYDTTDGKWGTDTEIMYTKYSPNSGWSNVSIVSDGFNGAYWNDDYSQDPSIAADGQGGVHVAWVDYTEGPWGGGSRDVEIMYAKLTPGSGWSNVTIITGGVASSGDRSSDKPTIAADEQGNVYLAWSESPGGLYGYDDEILFSKFISENGWSNASIISDGYGGNYWNDGQSDRPSIAVDGEGGLHVVWEDYTENPSWGTDVEIMYTKYSSESGWSNATVISDGFQGSYWNDGASRKASIAVDSEGGLHVVWHDETENPSSWGTDMEIMYTKYTEKNGWSFPLVISDGYGGFYWNDDDSRSPSIAVDKQGIVHVVWEDYTDGTWGTDSEIMYTKYSSESGWSNATVISDSHGGSYWNDGTSGNPSIAVDGEGRLHIVWHDGTENPSSWGTDVEIMYTKYTEKNGWSFPLVISDGYGGFYWNDDHSGFPSIAVGGEGGLHVVWQDHTDNPSLWGTDVEIMYTKVEASIDPENKEVPGSFTLNSTADTLDDDGIFYLSWTESKNADEYSVLIKNNGTNEILGSGLIDRTFPVMGIKNGTYTFEIEASNEYGIATSNQVNVTVSIPQINQNSNSNADNETQEDGNSSIPFGNHYLGILLFGVVSLVVIVYHKQKKE